MNKTNKQKKTHRFCWFDPILLMNKVLLLKTHEIFAGGWLWNGQFISKGEPIFAIRFVETFSRKNLAAVTMHSFDKIALFSISETKHL